MIKRLQNSKKVRQNEGMKKRLIKISEMINILYNQFSKAEDVQTGKRGIIHQFCYINDLPLKLDGDPLMVNWCKFTETDKKIGEYLYRNGFAIDYEITDENIENIALFGRSRWNI